MVLWSSHLLGNSPGASELEKEPSIVEIVDTELENSPSRITLLREFPETGIGDRTLGPYRMGQEIELSLWIAQHLVQMGYARYKEEEQLTLNTLSTNHYRQALPDYDQMPHIPT